jgi:hypothetical protein
VAAEIRGDCVIDGRIAGPMESPARGEGMPGYRYEIRIAGRLSSRARSALVDMDVNVTPPETLIADTVDDDVDLEQLLALIQSLGLSIVSVDQVAPKATDPFPDAGVGPGRSTTG